RCCGSTGGSRFTRNRAKITARGSSAWAMRSDEMRRFRRRTTAQRAIVIVAWCLSIVAPRAETLDRVLAVVAGRLIMQSDVTAARDLRLVPIDAGGDPIRGVLTRLIDRELVLVEVDRYAPPEPSAVAVDAELQGVRERFASDADLDEALARSGLDRRHLRETLRQDLRMRAYLDQRFAGAGDRRQALTRQWRAGLRRRGDIMDLQL